MRSLILRTVAPVLVALMVLFSIFVLLRGHNAPGGGFIGGLIAVAALSLYGIAFGVAAVRRALVVHPLSIAAGGLVLATLAGLLSFAFRVPFMTGLWVTPVVFGADIPLSSVMAFDLGVYLVVVGAVASIVLCLEERGGMMDPVFACLSGLFLAVGLYLLLSRSIVRMLLGVVVLGNAVNLIIFTAGRVLRAAPPILADMPGAWEAAMANPLPQALILTAIVISFSFFAFLLVLAWRALVVLGTDDTGTMRVAEPADAPEPPMGY